MQFYARFAIRKSNQNAGVYGDPVLSDQFVIEVRHFSTSAAAGQWGDCF